MSHEKNATAPYVTLAGREDEATGQDPKDGLMERHLMTDS
jgi:hypothetical protein